MTPAALEAVVAQLKSDEGFRADLYYDGKGVPTCGYGQTIRNWSPSFAEAILRLTLAQCITDVAMALPWSNILDDVRLGVLWQLRYNLGVHGLLEFHEMLGHLERGEYPQAGLQLIASAADHEEPARIARWAKQLDTGTLTG